MDKYLVKRMGDAPKKKASGEGDATNHPDTGNSATDEEEELDHSKAEQHHKMTSASSKVKEVKGDLFAASTSACLAHCISEDVRMGKGIAKIFKEKFGGVKELLAQGVKSGSVAVLKRGSRHIYYLITKEKYWNKPTYDSLRRSLQAMVEHCQRHHVRAVSMPRIGCGLDGLKWDRVQQIIEESLRGTDVSVTVYTL